MLQARYVSSNVIVNINRAIAFKIAIGTLKSIMKFTLIFTRIVLILIIYSYHNSAKTFDISEPNYQILLTPTEGKQSPISTSNSRNNPPLPWQIKIIEKVFTLFQYIQPKPMIPNVFGLNGKTTNNDDSYDFRTSSSLSKLNKFNVASFHNAIGSCKSLATSLSKHLTTLFNLHKNSFLFLFKTLGLTFVTVSFIYRIINWYKGIAEAEILLDKADYVYHSYGFNLNGLSSWLISKLNQTDIIKYDYVQIIKNLETSLDTPCFPRTMNSYANQLNKDIIPILNELQNRIQNSTNRFYNNPINHNITSTLDDDFISNDSQTIPMTNTTSTTTTSTTTTNVKPNFNNNINLDTTSSSSSSILSPAESTENPPIGLIPHLIDISEQKLMKGIQRCLLLIQGIVRYILYV